MLLDHRESIGTSADAAWSKIFDRPQGDPLAKVGRCVAWPFTAHPCDLAVCRTADRTSSVFNDDAAPPTAVHPIEREPFDSGCDVEHGVLIERDEVGVALHKADPVSVLNNSDGVSGQQRAPPAGSSRPVQHGRAVEVTTDSCQRESR